ncbi:hypothetical protein A0H76_1649 [Hepatospora eriocheir]|uniref:Uncharacterized protein n=1 Tax=Hepatospora eriocheir TaxID=1081669 RepID=A0A1X0QGR6_9MICR|nr:hypothetical protein A0H76_1649 [Hepatospora eriocheir]
MIWYLLFLKLNNSTNEVSSDTVENKNTNLKRRQNEFDNQPVSEKAKKIRKSDNEEEPPTKRQKTDETSKMSGETITGELEEPITLEEFNEIIGFEGLEEIEEKMEPDAIKEIMQSENTQNIILYSHITEETFNFFVELSKRYWKVDPSSSCFPDDINEQYKERIYEIVQRNNFSFPISMFDYYKLLKTQEFKESELEEIADLDSNIIQNNSNKLDFIECFLLKFVHILTFQSRNDCIDQNIEIINMLIDLINRYVMFYSYLLILKEVINMINNNDIDNLQKTKEELIYSINQNFLSYLSNLSDKEKFDNYFDITNWLNEYSTDINININEDLGDLVDLKLFDYLDNFSNLIKKQHDGNQMKKIIERLSYMYFGFIHLSYKQIASEIKTKCFDHVEKQLIKKIFSLLEYQLLN